VIFTPMPDARFFIAKKKRVCDCTSYIPSRGAGRSRSCFGREIKVSTGVGSDRSEPVQLGYRGPRPTGVMSFNAVIIAIDYPASI
jgi:hypothetical protein